MMMMSEEEKIEYLNSFPPGWKFVPTDEELIVEYLKKKLQNAPLPVNRIKDVHLYDHSPWELTENFTSYGENEYYFFTPRDRRYPKGSRPKRSAGIGYWKAIGNDKLIYDSNGAHIGSKKVLFFYEGKQPRGNKTPWSMHEYTATDLNDVGNTDATTTNVRAGTRSANGGEMQLDEWVLCKILYKKLEEPPAATPAATPATPITLAPATPVAPAPAPATPTATATATENHLNIIQVENSATREESTTTNICPGSDIYYGQGMFYFEGPNEVSFFKNGVERHHEDVLPIDCREERNYDHDMVNVVQAENTATREDNTTRNIYPGSDIYYGQGMFHFGRSNEVSLLEKELERHQENISSIEYREEQNYDQDMFNADHYLVIPPGIGSSESFEQ